MNKIADMHTIQLKRNLTARIALLSLAILILAGCAPPTGGTSTAARLGEPTMTAIPLPTWVTAQIAQVTATPAPVKQAASPTRTPTILASATSLPTATATMPPSPTQAPVPPTPTATATAKPRPRPRPTAAPELTGKLVFQASIDGSFYTINADGSSLHRITDGVDPIWSGDGRQIAFTRWRDPRGVWIINADGSGERRLFDWNETRWPSWSPDDSQVLFSRQHGGRTEDKEQCFWGFCFNLPAQPHWRLGIVDAANGAFSEPPSADVSLAPSWSPTDDQRIVYDGEHGLVIQSLDGTVSYAITNDGRDTGPTWAPDSSRIAFMRRQHDHWEIYAVNTDGRNLARLTDTPIRPDGTPGSSVAPAWSPDGQYIAFLTDRTGRWEIWIMHADGSGQRPMFATALDDLTLSYAYLAERAISWAW
jgi:WD40-like Beta Propeller Repeat